MLRVYLLVCGFLLLAACVGCPPQGRDTLPDNPAAADGEPEQIDSELAQLKTYERLIEEAMELQDQAVAAEEQPESVASIESLGTAIEKLDAAVTLDSSRAEAFYHRATAYEDRAFQRWSIAQPKASCGSVCAGPLPLVAQFRARRQNSGRLQCRSLAMGILA